MQRLLIDLEIGQDHGQSEYDLDEETCNDRHSHWHVSLNDHDLYDHHRVSLACTTFITSVEKTQTYSLELQTEDFDHNHSILCELGFRYPILQSTCIRFAT